jgi:hypothetical protein
MRALRVALVLSVAATVASAQTTLRGVVRDSATSRLVAGAVIEMRNGNTVLAARSDEAGEFRFRGIDRGRATISVRRIGYRPLVRDIEIDGSPAPIVIEVAPMAQRLAPVRVGAKGEGIYGIVAAWPALQPIAGAKVFVAGAGLSVMTDSAGEYFVALRRPGEYMVRVTAPGFAEDVFPMIVKKDQVEEASRMLDMTNTAPISGGMWIDFDERLRLRGRNSVLAPGSELRRAGGSMVQALQSSPSFAQRGLRFSGQACVFINGIPRPGMDPDQIPVDNVDAVEVYGDDRFERAVTELRKLWGRAPCGSSRVPGTSGGGSGVARWVVVWMKR